MKSHISDITLQNFNLHTKTLLKHTKIHNCTTISFLFPQNMRIMCSLLSLPKQWWHVTLSVVSILWKNKDVTTETPPNSPQIVSVVTILDTFEHRSKMLISTWLGSTVLNSCTHIKTKCYGITPQKMCLIAEKNVFGSVTHRFLRILNTFTLKCWGLSTHHVVMRERGTQEYFLIINLGVWLKSVSANGLKNTLFQ